MKKINNKGFTIVELIVTFALVMTISLGLFKVIDSYRLKQQRASYKKEMINYKNEIIRTVKDDIYTYGLRGITFAAPSEPTTEKIHQSVQLNFKNGGSDKYLYFGQEGCSGSGNNKVCEGKYYINYGGTKYKVPSEFIRFEDDVIVSCDDNDVAETVKTLVITSGNFRIKTINEKYCKINFRMKHTEIKDEVIIRIAAWYLTYLAPATTITVPTTGTRIRELELDFINPDADIRLDDLSNIMKLKIPCDSNTAVSKLSSQIIGKLSNATVIIGKKCTSIESEAFKGATGIKSLVFEDRTGETTDFIIKKSAFEGVALEGNVTLPLRLTKIESDAFKGNKLTRFIVPASLVNAPDGDGNITTKFTAVEGWNTKTGTTKTPVVIIKQ